MTATQQTAPPTGPAKLTDLTGRGNLQARPAGRKTGDLTNFPLIPVETTAAGNSSEEFSPGPAHPTIGRFDTFDFSTLEDGESDSASETLNDCALISCHAPAPEYFHPVEGFDESSIVLGSVEILSPGSAKGDAAVAIDAGFPAMECSLAEHAPPVRPVCTRGGAPLPQVITMAMGALLIVAGVGLVAAPVWRDALGLDMARSGSPTAISWFGIALILVGATLEVIGLRTRRAAH